MSSVAGAPGGRSTSFGVIFLVLFLDLVGFSIVFPLYADMLAYYGREAHGLLPWGLRQLAAVAPHATAQQREAFFGGLLGGIYSLLQFVAAPLWGRLSDRIGRRPVILASVTGSVVSYLIWVVSGSFALLLLSRIVAGVMAGNISVGNAAVADITHDRAARARGMGLIGMAFGLGFILGPAIGGISQHLGPRLDGSAGARSIGLNPFSFPAAIAALLSLLNLLWAFTHFRETLPAERRARQPVSSGRTFNPARLFAAGLGARIVRLNAAGLLHTVLFSGMETTLVFFTADRLGFRSAQNAWLFSGMGLVAALMQGGVFRRLAPRLGNRRLAIAGLVVLIPGFLLLALVDVWPSTALLALAVSALGVGTGFVFPALGTLVSLFSAADRQGEAIGTFRSAGALGRAIGPLIAALAYFAIRPSAPYVIAAVGILIPLAIVAGLPVEAEAQAGLPAAATAAPAVD